MKIDVILNPAERRVKDRTYDGWHREAVKSIIKTPAASVAVDAATGAN